jgi:16S rRNA (cytosine967-C5)-methyltransferase
VPPPPIPTAPRALALDRLLRLERDGAYVSRLSDGEAAGRADERRAADFVAGVTRHRRYLDFLIAQFYRGDAQTIEPRLRQVLRIGLYDLLIRETPPHAAVGEAVEVAKRAIRPGAGSLVNGILRSVLRARESGRLPQPSTGNVVRDLAVRHSHPNWIVRRWVERFGPEEAERLLVHDNAAPRYALRVNTRRHRVDDFRADLDALGVAHEASPYLDDFVRVERLQPVLRAGWFDEGRCAVQDEAAGLVVRLLDPQPGETVRDVCAAPGGKALYAAMRMGDEGQVLATDLNRGRAGLVRTSASKHGLRIVEAAAADARNLHSAADRVLLDAPCAGTGVLAKRADLRWQRSESDLADLTQLQDELLDAAAALVRPGGLLVYSTCSLEPEENEERVAAFLARTDGFSLGSAAGHVPPAFVDEHGAYSALPHIHGTDGAFAVRLRRSS